MRREKILEGLVTSAKKRAFLSVEGKMQTDQRGPPKNIIQRVCRFSLTHVNISSKRFRVLVCEPKAHKQGLFLLFAMRKELC